jgi:hypothetical protein
MLIESAIRLIDMLVFFPGWTFTAEDHSKRFEGTICLTIQYEARETGRENAEQDYPEKINTYAKFPIMVGDINTPEELYRRVLQCIIDVQIHEAREALRVAPTYWAPFHPHALGGMQAWMTTKDQPHYFSDDLKFGIS